MLWGISLFQFHIYNFFNLNVFQTSRDNKRFESNFKRCSWSWTCSWIHFQSCLNHKIRDPFNWFNWFVFFSDVIFFYCARHPHRKKERNTKLLQNGFVDFLSSTYHEIPSLCRLIILRKPLLFCHFINILNVISTWQ